MGAKVILEKKFKEQDAEIQDLKYELCKAEDDKDDAVKTALDEQKLQISSLETSNLEFDIKQKYSEVLQQLKKYEQMIAEFENTKVMFEKKSEEQGKEIQDLKYELCKAEDEKDEAVKTALDKQKDQISTLESKLQSQFKQLQEMSSNDNLGELKEKISSQNIDLASLRVELKRAEGDKLTASKKAQSELEMERTQVKRLKDEIRRLSTAQRQNQNARDLDSTYVAPA